MGRRPRRISDDEVRRAFAEYSEGARSLTDICDGMGITVNAMRKRFYRLDLRRRARHERILSDRQIAEAYGRYLSGESVYRLARRYYIDSSTLRQYIRDVYGPDVLSKRHRARYLDYKAAKALLEEYKRPGVTLEMLGQKVGVNGETVRNAFRHYGFDYMRFKG